jgi:hypothetical protein
MVGMVQIVVLLVSLLMHGGQKPRTASVNEQFSGGPMPTCDPGISNCKP